MKVWRLARRFLRSDLVSGELRALLLSVGLAVTALTAVAFFTDRVDTALSHQGAKLLAADLVIEHGDPLPAGFVTEASARGLETARTLEFPSVLFNGEKPVLVQVKGIGPGYPLRGELRVSGTAPATTPPPGEAWVEQRLLSLLRTALNSRVDIGIESVKITAVIEQEPDRGGQLIRFAPRIMLSLDTVDRTGLLGPASRVKHRLLVAGEASAIDRYRDWADRRLPKGAEVIAVTNARPELRSALERGERFLRLAALCAALLAGAAIALSTRLFVTRQTDAAAVLRCLGVPGPRIFLAFALRLTLLGLLASLTGVAIGYLAQFGLTALIGNWFGDQLPPPGLLPAWHGLLTGVVLLLGFALPPLLRLRRVPPLRALRRDVPLPPTSAWMSWLIAATAISLLIVWQVQDVKLASRVLGGVVIAGLLLAVGARSLIGVLRPLRRRAASSWRYGLSALVRRPGLTTLQVTGFGLGILALLLLAVVRVDLLESWYDSLPPGTPDHFALNILPEEVDAFRSTLEAHSIPNSGVYPMIRARLTQIGDRRVQPSDYESPRARRLAAREFNLSRSAAMQDDNKIVQGRWWQPRQQQEPWFSVELGLAQALGIELGDALTFEVAGETVTGEVTSMRAVRWDSFNVNFFVIGTPGLTAGLPASYVSSFYLPPGQESILAELAERFPSTSIIDVKPLMAQVRAVIDQGVKAVEAVFLFTLAAGVLVLYAAVQASRQERASETAVLRTLGAARARLLNSVVAEFAALGFLSGLLASGMASAIGYTLARQVFDLPWTPNPWLWAMGIGLGIIGVTAAGLIATWRVIHTPPAQILNSRFS